MPEIWGTEHLIYLAIFLVLAVISTVLVKLFCKSKRSVQIVIYSVAALLFITVVANRICLAVTSANWLNVIPDTFCGVTSFVFALAVLSMKNRNHAVFHCLVVLGLVGGLLTILYPDFIQQRPFFHSITITGLLHHSLSLYLGVLLLFLREYTPSIKKWYALPLGCAIYMTYGLFLMEVIGINNPMMIGKPLLAGTPFTWYVIGAAVIGSNFLIILVFEFFKKRRRLKAGKETGESSH